MSTAETPTRDDEAFLVPEEWATRIDPRRDGRLRPSVALDRGARAKVKRLLTKAENALTTTLDAAGQGDAELVAAAVGQRAGEPTPLGAAAVLAIVATTVEYKRIASLTAFADVWTKDHGAAFAAEAVVELAGIRVASRDQGRGSSSSWDLRRRCADFALAAAWRGEPVARRVRALLSAASDADYAAARDALATQLGTKSDAALAGECSDAAAPAEVRPADWMRSLVAAYLLPSEVDRVTALCAAPWIAVALPTQCGLVLRSVSTAEQLAALPLTDPGEVSVLPISAEDLTTLAEQLGPGVVPLATTLLDVPDSTGPDEHALLDLLAGLPGDAAFDAVAARLGRRHAYAAALAATRRDPERTWRRLPVIAAGGPIVIDGEEHDPAAGAARLLWDLAPAEHTSAEDTATGSADPSLHEARRAALTAVPRPADHRPSATDAELPALLAEPPWRPGGTAVEPAWLPVHAPADRGPIWRPGEREEWAATETGPSPLGPDPDWEALITSFRSYKLEPGSAVALFTEGPIELLSPQLRWFRPQPAGVDPGWLRRLAARHGGLVATAVHRGAEAAPHTHSPALLPYVDVRTVGHFTKIAASGPALAEAYLDRHGTVLVPFLTYLVTTQWHSEGHPARPTAIEWLRRLAARTSTAEVVTQAQACGDQAAAAIGELLALHPHDVLPRPVPVIGGWVDAALLPQILLRGGDHALPVDLVPALLACVGSAGLRREYAGLKVIEETCDPASLTRFTLALFQDWLPSRRSSDSGWVFAMLRYFGDDEAARMLARRLPHWASYGEPTLAEGGLSVLFRMGSDTALRLVREIAEAPKPASLKRSAGFTLSAAARDRGLDTEQLADRLVPDLGLSEQGTLELDYGSRRFLVGFDEALTPFVTNADGTARKSLPTPGVQDDAELAAAARRRFTELKKSVRKIAAEQVRRLESAMIGGRRWRRSDFEALIRHPVLVHLVRRLVWLVERDGRVVATVRVAEDRTLADVHDDVVAITATPAEADGVASVGTDSDGEPSLIAVPADVCFAIAHPLHLGAAAADWAAVFADYEITQSFQQLGRPVYELAEEERAGWDLSRFEGRQVPTGRVRALERRGWTLEKPEAGTRGSRTIISSTIGRVGVSLRLDPGFPMFDTPEPVQELSRVFAWAGSGLGTAGKPTLGDLDPIEASELLGALTDLTAVAG
ncbi:MULTISPECIES: DUF4132 domain-containing protein [Actinoalloteichus]|uniref:DUF4132 family protein n=1 Tax=Actinoalloteichus fjordicus TaxID=1612552 RepID=A0AAC9LDS6_9PSEU|nr:MULTISPECIES: DUF4132 domain-containing protein [Actinoalloteichus]APU16003.1 putative DUF4132 family protein [Actinoalloteichus fjordicus]APU22066.1 putative DUF4132 family protein [Actinoalloteichus sp. GBA129-24]